MTQPRSPVPVSPLPAGGPVRARLREYGMPPRILGVDVARGLAVLGMFGAHVGVTTDFDWSHPHTWTDVVNGRSSILFAVLAGVSIAILSGGVSTASGTDLLRARMRIFTRAVLVFALGGLLEFLGTAVAVILPVYAVLFVFTLPFLQWRPGRLFVLAGLLSVVSPVAQALLVPVFEVGADSAASDLLVTGTYPAIIWIVFALVGLAVGRLDLTARAVQVRLVGAGAALAVLGYGAGALTAAALGFPTGSARDDGSFVDGDLALLATTAPHSGSPFEVIGSTGFALAVLGLCLLVAPSLRWALYPIAAVGAMALTAYTVQIFVIAAIGPAATAGAFPWLYLQFVLVALVGCSVWMLLVGKGPLERFLTVVSSRAAGKGATRLRR